MVVKYCCHEINILQPFNVGAKCCTLLHCWDYQWFHKWMIRIKMYTKNSHWMCISPSSGSDYPNVKFGLIGWQGNPFMLKGCWCNLVNCLNGWMTVVYQADQMAHKKTEKLNDTLAWVHVSLLSHSVCFKDHLHPCCLLEELKHVTHPQILWTIMFWSWNCYSFINLSYPVKLLCMCILWLWQYVVYIVAV